MKNKKQNIQITMLRENKTVINSEKRDYVWNIALRKRVKNKFQTVYCNL